jgi:hypothetical protein
LNTPPEIGSSRPENRTVSVGECGNGKRVVGDLIVRDVTVGIVGDQPVRHSVRERLPFECFHKAQEQPLIALHSRMYTDAIGLAERVQMRRRDFTSEEGVLEVWVVEEPSTEPHIGTNDGGVDVRARRNELIDRTEAVVR